MPHSLCQVCITYKNPWGREWAFVLILRNVGVERQFLGDFAPKDECIIML